MSRSQTRSSKSRRASRTGSRSKPKHVCTLALGAALALTVHPTSAGAETGNPGTALEQPPQEYLSEQVDWLAVDYHPSARDRVRKLMTTAEPIREALRERLGADVLQDVRLRVAALPSELSRLRPHGVDDGAVFPEQRLVLLAATASPDGGDVGRTFRYRLAELALLEAVGNPELPPWFVHAFAEEFAGDNASTVAQTLIVATLRRDLIPLRRLGLTYPDGSESQALAEAQSVELMRFLHDRPAEVPFPKLVEQLRSGAPLDDAIRSTYGMDGVALDAAFREHCARRYAFLPLLLSSALLWLLLAGAQLARRALSRRRDALEPAGDFPLPEVPLASIPPEPLEEELRTAETVALAPEIPKVEHQGRWHTLH